MKTYEGMELILPYPENWTVSEERQGDWVDSVLLESPDSAFLSINRYPSSTATDEILERALQAMKAEYDSVESEDLAFDLGDGESFGCELRFYVLDLLVCSRLLSFQVEPFSYLVQVQAEDRDFDRLRPVVHAMLCRAIASLDEKIDVSELPL